MVGSGVVVKRGVTVAVGVKVEMRVAVAAFTATCGSGRISFSLPNKLQEGKKRSINNPMDKKLVLNAIFFLQLLFLRISMRMIIL